MNNLSIEIIYRKAVKEDVKAIWELLDIYSDEGMLLPLTQDDILSRINTFVVSEYAKKIVGCASLKNFGNNLYEVRSLAVNPKYTGQKLGSKLVNALINKSNSTQGSRIFALTYRESFFKRLGFKLVSKDLFPEKIWNDCEKCKKKEHCNEIAVLKIIQD